MSPKTYAQLQLKKGIEKSACFFFNYISPLSLPFYIISIISSEPTNSVLGFNIYHLYFSHLGLSSAFSITTNPLIVVKTTIAILHNLLLFLISLTPILRSFPSQITPHSFPFLFQGIGGFSVTPRFVFYHLFLDLFALYFTFPCQKVSIFLKVIFSLDILSIVVHTLQCFSQCCDPFAISVQLMNAVS